MDRSFTHISSRIDLYQSFTNFFEPEFVKEVIKIETERAESEDDFIAPLKLAIVGRYETDFRFHLNRYLYDLETILRMGTPETRPVIIKELEEEILDYKSYSTNNEILASVKERNDFKIFSRKERTGEWRKSSLPREETDKLDLQKVDPKILNLYFEIVLYYVELHNSYLQRLIEIGIHQQNTYYEMSGVLQPRLNRFIVEEKWVRFLSICDFYSDTRDYLGGYFNVKLVDYDEEKKTYTWTGIGGSVAPSMAEFIKKLESEKIVKQMGDKKKSYVSAFVTFFNMKSTEEFRKFIGKELNRDVTRFDCIFNHISTIK